MKISAGQIFTKFTSSKNIQRKKNVQKMSFNLAFFKNQSIATVFPLWPACLPCVIEELAKHWSISCISLDSTAIPFGAEIYKLKIFKNFPFAILILKVKQMFLKCFSENKNKIFSWYAMI